MYLCYKLFLSLLQFALEPMAASPFRPTSNITIGIFETGTPTVLTSTATWRSHGSRTRLSTSAFSSIYGRSPVTCSSATWTSKRSFCRDCRSYGAELSSNLPFMTPSSPYSSRCVRCRTWRCRLSEVNLSIFSFNKRKRNIQVSLCPSILCFPSPPSLSFVPLPSLALTLLINHLHSSFLPKYRLCLGGALPV